MGEELSETDGDDLRRRLEAARAELEALLEVLREGTKPVDLDTPIGRLTRMDAMQQQSMAKATSRADELRLGQIIAALGRMERGEYGDCLACGEPVALARLRARPEATLCVRCQDARERRSLR